MSRKEIRYRMPKNLHEKVLYLCDILGFHIGEFKGLSDEEILSLLSGVVLYHHVSPREQRRIKQFIYKQPGPIVHKVMPKITNPMVSPFFGLWSMSTEDLMEYHDYFDSVSKLGKILGVTFSFRSMSDLWKTVQGQDRVAESKIDSLGNWFDMGLFLGKRNN